jgi:alkanesulfonate monooxygenase SsuD/methylene tetrahydromethanopterin reductase-like flavin-dependent oxidoreductase (luciferase family)
LGMIRNQRTALLPPVQDMSQIWSPSERLVLKDRLRYAAIGGPATVAQSIQKVIELTQADELIINSEPYDDGARIRSFEIIAGS